MQLNISRNTMIASPLVAKLVVGTVKRKHAKAMMVEVDCLVTPDLDWNNLIGLHQQLQAFVYDVFTIGDRSFCMDALELLIREFALGEKSDHPDYIVFMVRNWEPFAHLYPDGVKESFSLVSFWFAHRGLASIIRNEKTWTFEDSDNLSTYVHTADYWKERVFVILSNS